MWVGEFKLNKFNFGAQKNHQTRSIKEVISFWSAAGPFNCEQ